MSPFTSLALSSFAAGTIATGVMLLFLYLPAFWGGVYYDTLGSIGAMFQKQVDVRGRLAAAVALVVGGIFFAFFYGAFALMFMTGNFEAPAYLVFPNLPTEINLFFLILGLVAGFGQGIYIAMLASFAIADYHPVPAYRDLFSLNLSFLVGHTVYGVVVMFFQHQLLQLLL